MNKRDRMSPLTATIMFVLLTLATLYWLIAGLVQTVEWSAMILFRINLCPILLGVGL